MYRLPLLILMAVFGALVGLRSLTPLPAADEAPKASKFPLEKFKEDMKALKKHLVDEDPQVRRDAADALREIVEVVHGAGWELDMAFRKNGEDAALAIALIRTVAEVGNAHRAFPGIELTRYLKYSNSAVREAAVGALSDIKYSPYDAVPAMIPLLKDEDLGVRMKTAGAFMVWGYEARAAAPALIEVAGNAKEDTEVRTRAVMSLGKMGPGGRAALPVLVQIFKEKPNDLFFRSQALISASLVAPEDKALLALAIEALKSKTEFEDRRSAAGAIASMGPHAKEAVPALLEALKAEDVRPADLAQTIRSVVIRALGRIGADAAAVPALTDILKDKQEHFLMRQLAATALGDIGPAAKSAIPVLRSAADDRSHPSVTQAAKEALGRIER